MVRYFNSPTRFTLGGEVRKAAYTMQNLIDGFETAIDDNQLTEGSWLESKLCCAV